jgi:hypothetical protein
MSKPRAFVIVLRIVFPLIGLALFAASVLLARENPAYPTLGAAALLGALVALSIIEEWLGHPEEGRVWRHHQPEPAGASEDPAAEAAPGPVPPVSDDAVDAEHGPFPAEPPAEVTDTQTCAVA